MLDVARRRGDAARRRGDAARRRGPCCKEKWHCCYREKRPRERPPTASTQGPMLQWLDTPVEWGVAVLARGGVVAVAEGGVMRSPKNTEEQGQEGRRTDVIIRRGVIRSPKNGGRKTEIRSNARRATRTEH